MVKDIPSFVLGMLYQANKFGKLDEAVADLVEQTLNTQKKVQGEITDFDRMIVQHNVNNFKSTIEVMAEAEKNDETLKVDIMQM